MRALLQTPTTPCLLANRRAWCISIAAAWAGHGMTGQRAAGQPPQSKAQSAPQSPITGLAVSADRQKVAGCSQDGLTIFSASQLVPVLKIPSKDPNVHDLRFDVRGNILVAGGQAGSDGTLRCFAVADGRQLFSHRCGEDVLYQASPSPDGRRIAGAGGDGTVYLLESSDDGHVVRRLTGHSGPVLTVAFIDSRWLLSAGRDRTIRLWDVETPKVVRSLNNHLDDVRDLVLKPMGTGPPVVASASADRTVRLWQPTIGRLVRFARLDSQPLALAWTPDGEQLVASCVDGRLLVIDPQTVEIRSRHAGLSRGWAYAVAAVSDRRVVIGGWGGELKSIDLK